MKRKDFLKLAALSPLAFGMKNLQDLHSYSESLSASEKTPLLFLGHGSPMNAIEENQFVTGFRDAGKIVKEKPKAILCISAHWFTRGTKVTAMEKPRTIHDFGGFPEELFKVQYPAPGDPALASETKSLLDPTLVELDEKWGLDHGTWSVVKHLYPNADVPVIQLSIDYSQPASYHYALAKKLSKLREKGILIIGSGNIVHNLGLVDFRNFEKDNYGYDWAIEARAEINKHILDGNHQALIDYQKQSRAWQLAIPSPDHYLPLIYILGLKGEKEKVSLFNDKLMAGSLSMTGVSIS